MIARRESDLGTAEDIVQDSFAAVHGVWQAHVVASRRTTPVR